MNHINVFNNLPDSPKVAQFAKVWKCSTDEALGRMVRWLCWLDKYTTDGRTSITAEGVDALVFAGKRCTAGLVRMGWAGEDNDGLVFAVDFGLYNGPTAKKRAIETAKKRNQRANKKLNK